MSNADLLKKLWEQAPSQIPEGTEPMVIDPLLTRVCSHCHKAKSLDRYRMCQSCREYFRARDAKERKYWKPRDQS